MTIVQQHLRVFLGSSGQSKALIEAMVNRLKEHTGLEAVQWTQVFDLSVGTMEALEKELDDCDFAVLLLAPDDTVIKGGSQLPRRAARDNVIFELGLFMGRLGRDRTFAVFRSDASDEVFSDFKGITYAPYDTPADDTPESRRSAVEKACDAILHGVRKLGPRTPYRLRKPLRVMVTGSQSTRHVEAVKSAEAFGRRLADLDVRALSGVATGVDEAFRRGFAERLREKGKDPKKSLICYYKKNDEDEKRRAQGEAKLQASSFEHRSDGVPELVADADIIVLFGGGSSVAYMGAVALQEKRIVIPVAATGGSVKGLLDAVLSRYDSTLKGLVSRDDLEALRNEDEPETIAKHCFELICTLRATVPSVE